MNLVSQILIGLSIPLVSCVIAIPATRSQQVNTLIYITAALSIPALLAATLTLASLATGV